MGLLLVSFSINVGVDSSLLVDKVDIEGASGASSDVQSMCV